MLFIGILLYFRAARICTNGLSSSSFTFWYSYVSLPLYYGIVISV